MCIRDRVLYDAARTDWLTDQGWTVVRVSNKAVLQDFDRVVADIRRALADTPPSTRRKVPDPIPRLAEDAQ